MSGRITWEIVASLWMHVCLGAALMLGEQCSVAPEEPLFNPQDVMRVSMSPMPYAEIAQKASRAPEASAGVQEPPPEPAPPQTNSSEMVLNTPEDTPDPVEKPPEPDPEPPKEQQGEKKEPSREDLLNQAARERLLENLSAPEGAVDRSAAGPTGTADGVAASAISLSDAPPAVQEYMQTCMDVLHSKWSPLPSLVSASPHLLTTIRIPISRNGRFGEHRIVVKSGDNSFDRSANMAVLKTQKCPPFPAEITDETLVLNLEFPASDKL